MPNIKRISAASAPALTVYAIVRRGADGYLLDDATGSFSAAPADPYLALAEHATIKGLYSADEARAAWDDGAYEALVYEQVGGSPAPATDQVIGAGVLHIASDAEAKLDVSVSSRATAGDIASAFGEGVLQSRVTALDGDPVTVVRGDVATLTFALGTAWDLTGMVAYLCIKADPEADNSTAIVNRELTVTDAAGGACEIELTSAETATVGKYYAEVEVREADGTNPRTAFQFPVRILQDVRQ